MLSSTRWVAQQAGPRRARGIELQQRSPLSRVKTVNAHAMRARANKCMVKPCPTGGAVKDFMGKESMAKANRSNGTSSVKLVVRGSVSMDGKGKKRKVEKVFPLFNLFMYIPDNSRLSRPSIITNPKLSLLVLSLIVLSSMVLSLIVLSLMVLSLMVLSLMVLSLLVFKEFGDENVSDDI